MRSSILLSFLLPFAAGLDFDKVYQAKPRLRNATPVRAKTIDRRLAAASVLSVMQARHTPVAAKMTSKRKTTTKTSRKTSTKASTKHSTTHSHTTRRSKRSTRHHVRDAGCVPQSNSYNYVPSPNTPSAFLTDNSLASISINANAPAGYSGNFTDAFGSLFANNYINYYQLAAYNVSQCAQICDSISSCFAFNIYFERDPTLDPATSCQNPTAAVSVRCALWGSYIYSAQAQNLGEWRQNFMVAIQGSNGYNKNIIPATVSSFVAPAALAAAVDTSTIPAKAGIQSLDYTFTAGAYDARTCARSCQAKTAQNKAAALASGSTSYTPCNWFNAFVVTYNSTAQGMYCQLFSADASEYATQYTQVSNGVTYGLTYSYGYALSMPDSGSLLGSTTTSSLVSTSSSSLSGSSATTDTTTLSSASTIMSTVSTGVSNSIVPSTVSIITPSVSSVATVALSSVAVGVSASSSSIASPSSTTMTTTTVAPMLSSTSSSTTIPTTTTTSASISSSTTTMPTTAVTAVRYAAYTTTTINSGTATTVGTSTLAPATSGGTAIVQITYPTPQSCQNSAVAYAAYPNLVSNVAGLAALLPESYKATKPSYSGVATYMGEYNDVLNSDATIYGNSGKKGQALVLDHKFYVFANQAGNYSISVTYADDIAFVWSGAKAVSGWTRANADFTLQLGSVTGANSATSVVSMSVGQYVPVRIMWANTIGIGDFRVSITGPDGGILAASTAGSNAGVLSGSVVQFPCNSASGAAFPAWGSET